MDIAANDPISLELQNSLKPEQAVPDSSAGIFLPGSAPEEVPVEEKASTNKSDVSEQLKNDPILNDLRSSLQTKQEESKKETKVANKRNNNENKKLNFVENLTGKANEMIATAAGAPSDIGEALFGPIVEKITGKKTPEESYGSGAIKSFFNKIGAGTNYDPESMGSQAAEMGLTSLAMAPLGAMAAGSKVAGPIVKTIGSALADNPLGQAAMAVPMSIGGKYASELVPDAWKPTAEFVGQLGSGLITSLATKGASAIGNAVSKAYDSLGFGKAIELAPGFFATEKQAAAVGNKILSEANDPNYVRQTLSEDNVLVPGTSPTLAEVLVKPSEEGNIGDVGISNWQRNLHATVGKELFNAQQENNTLAEINALKEAKGKGDPTAIVKLFQSQRDEIANNTQKEINDAVEKATAKASEISGDESGNIGDQIEKIVAKHHEEESNLWNSFFGKNKNAPIGTKNINNAVDEVISSVDPAKPALGKITATEQEIYSTIKSFSENEPFENIKKLRSAIGEAQRSIAKAAEPDYGASKRLGEIKKTIDATLDSTVAKAAEKDQSVYEKLISDRENYLAERQKAAGRNILGSNERNVVGGDEILPGSGRTEIQEASGFRGSERASGGSEASGPNLEWSKESSTDYKVARAKTLEGKSIFKEGPLKIIMDKQGKEISSSPEKIEALLFNRQKGPELIRSVLDASEKAGVAKEETISALEEMASRQIRSQRAGIMNPDGTMNAKKLQSWMTKNKEIIESIPGFAEKIKDVHAAQQTMSDIQASAAKKIDDFAKTEASKFLQNDPETSFAKTFASKDPKVILQKVKETIDSMKGNKEALEGYKALAGDYILRKVRGLVESDVSGLDITTPKKLRQWLSDNKEAVKAIFGGQGLNNIERVAANTYRRRAIDVVRTPGQSNSPEDFFKAVGGMPVEKTVFDHIIDLGILGGVAHNPSVGVPMGIAKGVFQVVKNSLNAKNIKTKDMLELKAALDPEFAKILFQKAEKLTPSAVRKISTAINKTLPPVVLTGVIANQLPSNEKVQNQ